MVNDFVDKVTNESVLDIIKKFETYGLNIKIVNKYIYLQKTNGKKLLEAFKYNESYPYVTDEHKKEWEEFTKDFYIQTIKYFEDPEPTLGMESSKEIPVSILFGLRKWFKIQNNLVNNFLKIEEKLNEDFPTDSRLFRPTAVLHSFRTSLDRPDLFSTFSPAKDNSREIVYNLFGKKLTIIYLHNPKFEKVIYNFNGENLYEEWLNDQSPTTLNLVMERFSNLAKKQILVEEIKCKRKKLFRKYYQIKNNKTK